MRFAVPLMAFAALSISSPGSAQGRGDPPLIAGDPEFLPRLFEGDFEALGTSSSAVAELVVIGQAATDANESRDQCPDVAPVDLGVSEAEVMAAMIALGRRYPRAAILGGLSARGHPTYLAVLPWLLTVECDDPVLRRIGVNTARYLVWLYRQGTTEADEASGGRARSSRAPEPRPAAPASDAAVEDFVAEATRNAEPHALPHLDGDLLFVLFLAHGLAQDVEPDWAQLAFRRLNYEADIRRQWDGDFEGHSYWPPVFPEGAEPSDITDAVVSSYRDWTMARANRVPDRVLEWGYWYAYQSPADGRVPLYRPTQVTASQLLAARAAGIDIERTRLASPKPGAASFVELLGSNLPSDALMVYPRPVSEYVVELPEAVSDFPPEELRLLIQLRIESVRILPVALGGGLRDFALLEVTPGDVLFLRDGEELWRGAVSVR